jgi:hypothetical protein
MFAKDQKNDFTTCQLHVISISFNSWHFLPTLGRSGGLLIGFCDNSVVVQGVSVGSFSITIFLKNTSDGFV